MMPGMAYIAPSSCSAHFGIPEVRAGVPYQHRKGIRTASGRLLMGGNYIKEEKLTILFHPMFANQTEVTTNIAPTLGPNTNYHKTFRAGIWTATTVTILLMVLFLILGLLKWRSNGRSRTNYVVTMTKRSSLEDLSCNTAIHKDVPDAENNAKDDEVENFYLTPRLTPIYDGGFEDSIYENEEELEHEGILL